VLSPIGAGVDIIMMRTRLVLLSFCVSASLAASEQQRPGPSNPPEPSLTQELKRLSIEELAELDATFERAFCVRCLWPF
jgi:hypothetical protein